MTQGPACALACAAGTVYRNYLVPRTDMMEDDESSGSMGGGGGGDREVYKSAASVDIVHMPYKGKGVGGSGRQVGSRRRIGQTEFDQINNLSRLEKLIGNDKHCYWRIKNGYTNSSEDNLAKLNSLLSTKYATEESRDELIRSVQLGVQSNVGVDFSERFLPIATSDNSHLGVGVTQCYCSALSCGYTGVKNSLWEPFARLVLDAMYEGTILTGI